MQICMYPTPTKALNDDVSHDFYAAGVWSSFWKWCHHRFQHLVSPQSSRYGILWEAKSEVPRFSTFTLRMRMKTPCCPVLEALESLQRLQKAKISQQYRALRQHSPKQSQQARQLLCETREDLEMLVLLHLEILRSWSYLAISGIWGAAWTARRCRLLGM